MFNPKAELMPEAFKYVTGELEVSKAPKDAELFKILCACGVAKLEKGEIKVFNSRNMLNPDNCVYLTHDQVKAWKELDFTMNFQLRGKRNRLDVIVEKLPGDNHATVADSHGNHIFGAVVCLQDSRSPWIFFEGDERPWTLQFTNKQTPNDSGMCAICTGWVKKSDPVTKRNSYIYDEGFEIWSCTKIVRKILADYFGHEFEHLNSDLNNTERAKFLRSGDGAFYQDIGDKILEISKNVGESIGSILLGTTNIGTISVDPTPKSFGVYSGQINFNEDIDQSVNRVQVENAIWQMICPNGKTVYSSSESEEFGVKPNFKKNGKKGKKQFAH